MDSTTLLSLKVAAGPAALLAFALLERARPYRDDRLTVRLGRLTRAGLRRLGRNLGLFGLNAPLSPALVLPVTAWAASHGLGLRPAAWSGWTGLALDLLLLDLWLYAWHRANHVWPPLWRFHEVHHLDEALDTTTGVRFHPGEVALSAFARVVPIVVLGIPFASVALYEALLLAAVAFHHSDARLPPGLERRLSRVIVTPSLHWVHHHARRADTDSNYGSLFSFWDVLFRSRSRTARTPGMRLGVERRRDRPLADLLLRPLAVQPRANATAPSARR
jgi:sterol desaturase/sphingolipid hydroxylase (fatty acid hydroxylase superfamily)